MTMEIDLGPAARAFRDELREWLDANKPEELIGVDAERAAMMQRTPVVADWLEKLRDGGYLCVSWPKEFGGRGLSGIEVAVMNEEFGRAGVPRVTRGMGEWLVGPSIIVWGTDEQKAHFLPRIIDGTDRYCQGFSEPDAGSDLAGLKTRGIVDGDEVVITGQKVWTSGAQAANMMFCLCRTDPDAPKHKGISYVLTPMYREDGSSNGFELRPIKQMTGGAHFTETFIHEARAPVFNVIGGLHNGWRVTMTTLGNERGGNATTQHVQYTKQFWDAVKLTRELGKNTDATVRQDLAWAYTHVEIMRFQGLKLLSEVVAKKEPGPAASINKMFWSEYAQRFSDRMMNIRGADAMLLPEQKSDEYAPDKWTSSFLSHRSSTIWGGTAQVQRNIVSERVLGLPKEPGSAT
ncbi:MAG TPA: acyl-CoA dehydrogenase family protein [Acidimicrobiales bacterium]|nr:acyl-CoA dehydrogenase family protein [Acidimicrobiales bacterium]